MTFTTTRKLDTKVSGEFVIQKDTPFVMTYAYCEKCSKGQNDEHQDQGLFPNEVYVTSDGKVGE